MYKKELTQPSTIKSFLLFPILTAFADTGAWISYNVFRMPYLWSLVIIYLFFCIHILRARKKSKISIMKFSFYFASSPAIGIIICIIFGIRAFIISGNIQFIILNVVICILVSLFAVMSSVKCVKWSIVRVNRKPSKKPRKKQEPAKYVGVLMALFVLFIVPRIFPEDIMDEQLFLIVLYMIYFFLLSFIVSLFGYVIFLIAKFDCADIKV